MGLFDTHCHIHEIIERTTPVHDKWLESGITEVEPVLEAALAAGVTEAMCVGTTYKDSELAVQLVQKHANLWASVGIHPHEAKDHVDSEELLDKFADLLERPKVVAIGECGLDYFYTHSPKTAQKEVLEYQLKLAVKYTLPVIFHVREAFEDFWPIFDKYSDLTGVIHSFSAGKKELTAILDRNLYVGLNGIMTFTKQAEQLEAAKSVPLERLLIETDAPFLTPAPYRGTINQLRYLSVTAGFLAELRGENLADFTSQTSQNAQKLFKL